MKSLLTCIFILLSTLSLLIYPHRADAQFTVLGSSAAFTEPEEGFAKILILKNGNTCYTHIKEKGGMAVKIFDADRKKIADTEFATAYGNVKGASIEGFFELNGDITVLIMLNSSWGNAMHRLIIDGNTGSKKAEILLRKLDAAGPAGYKDVRDGNALMPGFIVRKDPHSENYAIGINNSTAHDRSKRINVIHYDRYHKEISNVYLHTGLFPEFEYCNLVDLAVHEDKDVQVVSEVFKRVNKEKQGAIKMVKIAAGMVDPGIQTFPQLANRSITGSTFLFNRDYSRLFLLALIFESRDQEIISYSSRLVEFNTANLAFTEKKTDIGNVLPLMKTKYPKSTAFNSIPVGILLNNEGGVTVLSESIQSLSVYGDVLTSLGNIIVSAFDASGNLMNTSVIISSRKTDGQRLGLLYYNENEQGAVKLKNGNHYKYFKYLQTPKTNYILMNDLEPNESISSDGEVKKAFGAVRSAYPYYYKLGDPLPVRNWMFPKPAGKEHPVSIFPVSDYDVNSNILCTTQLDHGGGGGKIKLIWLNPS
jgi:hypothetical protein